MAGSANLEGVNIQLQKHTTKLDLVLLSPAGFDAYGGQASVKPYVNKAVDYRIYQLTSVSKATQQLQQSAESNFKVTLTNSNAQRLRRIWVNIEAPPICNTVTNIDHAFNALSLTASTAIASIAAGGNLSGGAGSFTDGETVTITSGGGGGSGFSATVTASGGNITAISVVAGGLGYSTATGTLTGSSSGATKDYTASVLGAALSEFPNPNGRMVIPAVQGNVYNGQHLLDTTTAADRFKLRNSICVESDVGSGDFTRTLAGNDTSGLEADMDMFRTYGLSIFHMAASYTRLAPAALIKSATLVSGTGVLFTLDPKQIMFYNDYLASTINQMNPKRNHSFHNTYDLKMASMDNCSWSILLPFPFCHGDLDSALNISAGKAQELELQLVFNGWETIIENSPTYNSNLTITPAATVTSTAPADADHPAGVYAAALGTYTVAGGRIDKTKDVSMLSTHQTSGVNDGVVVPSTAIANKHFAVSVEVEYVHYFDESVKANLKKEVSTQVVPVFKKLATYSFDGTAATHSEVTQNLIAKFPTSHLVFFNQRNSAKLLNKPFDFSPFSSPVYFFNDSHDGFSNSNGAPFTDFHNKIGFDLASHQRCELTPREMKDLMPQTFVTKPIAQNAGLYVMSFSDANPYAMQQDGSVSMSAMGSHDRTLRFYPNKGGCLDQRYIGGLSSDKFTTEVWAWQQQILKVDGQAGTLSVQYNN